MGRHDNRELIGTVVDRKYKIIELLGEGGMGTVYKVRHLSLKRDCAIKIIKRRHAADPVALKRFQLEAEAASMLQHPNIIEIYDYGVTQDNLPYIVMEYLAGESLDDVLERHRFLHFEQAIPIFIQICDALAHAHEKNVLHRDLKPDNIMLHELEDRTFIVKLLDFGVAKLLPGTGRSVEKLSITGEICGSPLYMSPEQCMGQALDLRSDIYSLGCVFYETLCGRLPCNGDSLFQVVMRQVNDLPPPFSQVAPDIAIPEELEAVIMKCLSKERALRFETVKELKRRLSKSLSRGRFQSAQLPPMDFNPEETSLEDGETVIIQREQIELSNRKAVEETLWKEIRMLEDRYGQNCRYIMGPIADLYRLYKDAGLYAKAAELKHRQLELINYEYGEESLDAAYCLDELGALRRLLASPQMSEYSFREALSIKVKVLGPDDPDTCKTRIDLANALVSQERINDAEILVEESLLAVYRSRGNLSLDAANIEIMIGNFYYDLDNLYKAFDHFESAALIVSDLLGAEHIKLADCYMDMARCKHFLANYQEAVDLCYKVIAINDLNPEFTDIVFEHPWSQLSWSLRALKEFAGAEQACFKSLEILEGLGYATPSRLAQVYDTLVKIYKESGQLEKAGDARQKSRELIAFESREN